MRFSFLFLREDERFFTVSVWRVRRDALLVCVSVGVRVMRPSEANGRHMLMNSYLHIPTCTLSCARARTHSHKQEEDLLFGMHHTRLSRPDTRMASAWSRPASGQRAHTRTDAPAQAHKYTRSHPHACTPTHTLCFGDDLQDILKTKHLTRLLIHPRKRLHSLCGMYHTRFNSPDTPMALS